MRHLPPSFDATVSAFREMTAMPSEGDATRARVLACAGRDLRRRILLRRSLVPLAIVLVILSSGAVLTAAGFRWYAPAPAAMADAVAEPRSLLVHPVQRPARIVPPVAAELAVAGPPNREDGERLAYERAHRAHFFAAPPERALAAWDEYLAGYPRGTFAPEARYNRALCLVRLGRLLPAAEGLRPFARGRLGGYRKSEACQLLRWLSERDARVASEPHCDAAAN